VDNLLENDLTAILWPRRQNVGNEDERAHGLVEVVAVVKIVVVVVEAVVDLLQTLAELTSLPSLELQLHGSASVIKEKGLFQVPQEGTPTFLMPGA
jgi:hypothetical protein